MTNENNKTWIAIGECAEVAIDRILNGDTATQITANTGIRTKKGQNNLNENTKPVTCAFSFLQNASDKSVDVQLCDARHNSTTHMRVEE